MSVNQVQRAAEMRKAIQMWAASLVDNEEAMIAIPSIYPEWEIGKKYKIKDVISYGVNSVGDIQLYQVLQEHTSQEQYTPDAANSLYKKVGVTSSGYPLWVQPLGATDAYNIGDIVSYKNKLYKSIINSNVWSPDVYPAGWEEYTESTGGGSTETTEPDTPSTDNIKEFVQPTGAHDAYKKGDKVKYNGKIYESLIDSNVYSPDAYPAGWKEVEG